LDSGERIGDGDMAKKKEKQQIYDLLKDEFFSTADDFVDVSDGPEDSIHLVLVSRKFDGKRLRIKHEMISDFLRARLPEDIYQKISLTICRSPDEIKAGV
jgi:stress-induced morphogen